MSVVVGDMMYVTAGSGSEELWFNDFYALDLDCDTWVKYDPQQGSTPTPRDYTSLDVISNKVTDWPTLGTDQLSLGNDWPPLGTDQLSLGNDWPTLGTDQLSLGNDWPPLGTDQLSLGNDWPTLGNDWPTLGTDWPTLGTTGPHWVMGAWTCMHIYLHVCFTRSIICLQYLVEFGGFSGTSGVEECFSDLHYAHICSSELPHLVHN